MPPKWRRNTLLSQARTGGFDQAAAAKGRNAVTTDSSAAAITFPESGRVRSLWMPFFSETEKGSARCGAGPARLRSVPTACHSASGDAHVRRRFVRRLRRSSKTNVPDFCLHQKTQELSDRAKADHDLKKSGQGTGCDGETSDLVAPDGQVPDIGSMSSASAIFFPETGRN